jgi:signal transduction histidine kinase
VSRPLRALAAQLRQSELSGGMSGHLTAGRGVRELASLAEAYNRVADSEQLTRQQLEEARDAAQLANRLKDEFLTNVSHELRTPLNGVLGMTDLLLYTTLDSEQKDFVLTARNSAETLLSLIDNVLNFSQLQTGKASLHVTDFDLRKVVEESAEAIFREANAKGIDVSVLCSQDMPGRVAGDEIRIRQILAQLCGNAVKFTDMGFIRIRLECQEEAARAKVKITVEDTGIGIAADQQSLIFSLFTQADGSMTRQRGGTGLGLTLVKDLVALMNGKMGVDSRLREGSAFWVGFDLPVPEAKAGAGNSLQEEFGAVPC